MPENQNIAQFALDLYQKGRKIESGAALFRAVSADEVPEWAANVLSTCIRLCEVNRLEFDALITLSRDVSKWHDAKLAFDGIRDLTLDLEDAIHGKRPTCLLCCCYLAENVAKVIYNASVPHDPFDDDSGDWITSCALELHSLCIKPDGFVTIWNALIAYNEQ